MNQKFTPIWIGFLALTSCSTLQYSIKPHFIHKRPVCEPVSSYGFQETGTKFSSKNECEQSDELKQAVLSYEEKEKYQVFMSNEPTKTSDVFCEKGNSFRSRFSSLAGKETFADSETCENSEEFKKIKAELAKKIKISAQRAAAARIAKIDDYIKNHPGSEGYRQATVDRKIKIGMPEGLVYLSWGRPERSNDSVRASGVSKQLVYGSTYVYIDDGRISSWQVSR